MKETDITTDKIKAIEILQKGKFIEAKEEEKNKDNTLNIIFSTYDSKTGEVRECTQEEKEEYESWMK